MIGWVHISLLSCSQINEETLTIKLTDFGQARQFGLIPEKYTLHVQAMYYRAPELLLGCSMYSELIDVWSIGYDLCAIVTVAVE